MCISIFPKIFLKPNLNVTSSSQNIFGYLKKWSNLLLSALLVVAVKNSSTPMMHENCALIEKSVYFILKYGNNYLAVNPPRV